MPGFWWRDTGHKRLMPGVAVCPVSTVPPKWAHLDAIRSRNREKSEPRMTTTVRRARADRKATALAASHFCSYYVRSYWSNVQSTTSLLKFGSCLSRHGRLSKGAQIESWNHRPLTSKEPTVVAQRHKDVNALCRLRYTCSYPTNCACRPVCCT